MVGLGNYTLPDTRHSVGMLVVDCLSKQLGAAWQFNRRSMGHLAATTMNNHKLILLKPTVAMNINGKSIARTGMCTTGNYYTFPQQPITYNSEVQDSIVYCLSKILLPHPPLKKRFLFKSCSVSWILFMLVSTVCWLLR